MVECLDADVLRNNVSPQVAVKVINKTELKDTDYMMRNLHREADVLRKISHENIVNLYEVNLKAFSV